MIYAVWVLFIASNLQMRELRLRFHHLLRVNLLSSKHSQAPSPRHLRGLHHFIYRIIVLFVGMLTSQENNCKE